jgi:hypothetical protein
MVAFTCKGHVRRVPVIRVANDRGVLMDDVIVICSKLVSRPRQFGALHTPDNPSTAGVSVM